jgi:hypothetical protein
MFAAFVRRTSSATALLLAVLGLPASLLAAPDTQRLAGTAHTAAAPGQARPQGVPPYRRNIAAAAKSGKRPVTPFDRVILPKIKAEQALARASADRLGSSAGASAGTSAARIEYKPSIDLTGPGGLPVNFPGFQQPPWFFVNGSADTLETFIALTVDVNKDGKPDLVTIQADGTLNVLLNTGSGLPTNGPSSINSSAVTYSPNTSWASAVDLNNDGFPDIEVVDPVNDEIYTFMNNGDGTFAPVTQISLGSVLPSPNVINFGGEYGGGDVLFAKITGHATPDMIVVSGTYAGTSTRISVQIFEGVGDGTFPSSATYVQSQTLANTSLYGSFHSVQAVDMNGDGKLDLVYPTTGVSYINDVSGVGFSYNYVLTGNNQGVFSSLPIVSDTSVGAFPDSAPNNGIYASYMGDAGNGNTPALVVIGYGASYSQISNGDGTLQPPVALANPDIAAFDYVNFADVNGDGKVDVIGEGQGYFSIYDGNGDGTFSATADAQYVATYGSVLSAQPADFNGDGKVDIVSVSRNGDAGVFPGAGNGIFAGAPLVAPPTDVADNDYSIEAANFAGHGYSDVLLYDTNGDATDLVTGINDGHGNFTYVTGLSSTVLDAINWEFVYSFTVDINNDGKSDLVIAANFGPYYALSNGDGTFAAPVALPIGGSTTCTFANGAAGDLNNDGKTDLVFAYQGCGVGDFQVPGYFMLLNNGDSTFTPSFTSFGDRPYSVPLADMNNDGNLDLVLLDETETGDSVYVIPGNGDGTFNTANPALVTFQGDIYSVLTGDYDGDGKQDLALIGFANGYGVNLLKGHGDFTFTPGASFLQATYVDGAQYVDFNNDGRPDLALNIQPLDAPYLGFAYSVNLGGGGFSDPTLLLSSYAGDGGSVIIADFNGDGAPDALATSYYTSGIFYNTGAIVLNLAASASSATQDSPVTLTATLVPSLNSAPATGTVTFYDNAAAIGSAPVSGDAATLTLSTLAVGANAITAVYSGDVNYNSATSTASVNGTANVAVTALPPAFTMTAASGSSLDLTVGQTGTATFTVTGNATFSGPITFACSNVPKDTSCTVLPGTLTLSGAQTATISVVLATTAPNNHYDASNFIPTWMKTTGGITLAGGLLLLLPSRRRRNLWPVVLFASLGLGAALSLSGCSHKYSGTPAGTYSVNVTATAGSLTQTGTIALTIHN